jgi:hypothetical protein
MTKSPVCGANSGRMANANRSSGPCGRLVGAIMEGRPSARVSAVV